MTFRVELFSFEPSEESHLLLGSSEPGSFAAFREQLEDVWQAIPEKFRTEACLFIEERESDRIVFSAWYDRPFTPEEQAREERVQASKRQQHLDVLRIRRQSLARELQRIQIEMSEIDNAD